MPTRSAVVEKPQVTRAQCPIGVGITSGLIAVRWEPRVRHAEREGTRMGHRGDELVRDDHVQLCRPTWARRGLHRPRRAVLPARSAYLRGRHTYRDTARVAGSARAHSWNPRLRPNRRLWKRRPKHVVTGDGGGRAAVTPAGRDRRLTTTTKPQRVLIARAHQPVTAWPRGLLRCGLPDRRPDHEAASGLAGHRVSLEAMCGLPSVVLRPTMSLAGADRSGAARC